MTKTSIASTTRHTAVPLKKHTDVRATIAAPWRRPYHQLDPQFWLYKLTGASWTAPTSRRKTATPTLPAAESTAVPRARAGARRTQPSKMADVLGMSPSADIDMLLKARRSAQAAAEASGTGRRARVPSRKALEAAGLATAAQGAPQWMTRELKEQEKKRAKELRHQRVEDRAARPKKRVAAMVPIDDETISSSGRGGAGPGCRGGVGATAGDGGGVTSRVSINNTCPATQRSNQEESMDSRTTYANALGRHAAEALKRDIDNGDGEKSQKKLKVVAPGPGNEQASKAAVRSGRHPQDRGDGVDTKTITQCTFDKCVARATFGVNSIARYWCVVVGPRTVPV